MAILFNARHELFAQGVAAGETAVAAYRRLYPRSTAVSCGGNAYRLLKRPEARERVWEIQRRAET